MTPTFATIRSSSKSRKTILFAYWKYHGTDFAADAEEMLSHPAMKRWWEVCTPLQEALATRKPGEWWATMQQVFFTDLWALSNRPRGAHTERVRYSDGG
jgi:hypothetical protein